MAISKKSLKYSKFGLTGSHKRIGINFWRFFFSGVATGTGVESRFFIEIEMLNPWYSPSEPLLGYKPRIKIKEEDLQYALAGTQSAMELQSEKIVTPSYVVIRVGRMDGEPKQLCTYIPVKQIKFNSKPFEIIAGKQVFSENDLSGEIVISGDDITKHPEYLCDQGTASWNLKYDIIKDCLDGYENQSDKWFPLGMQSCFSGILNFDGDDFVVEPKKSFGYIDRYWAKSFPEVWFHLSSSNLTSMITGKTLFNTAFTAQGIFENNISFLANFEGLDIQFCADNTKGKYTTVWNCLEAPEPDEDGDKRLHWSLSINSKQWIMDLDIYCKLKDLYNRKLELPEGERKVLSVLQSATGIGEIKLYKRIKNDLEQIEYARISNAVCEFGHIEETDNN